MNKQAPVGKPVFVDLRDRRLADTGGLSDSIQFPDRNLCKVTAGAEPLRGAGEDGRSHVERTSIYRDAMESQPFIDVEPHRLVRQ